MTELGNVLELLCRVEPRFRTLQVEGRQLRRDHPAPKRSAAVILTDDKSGTSAPKETVWRIWIDDRGRKRTELEVGSEVVTAVRDGVEWASWSSASGPMTRGRTGGFLGLGFEQALLNTFAILPAVELEVLGRTEFIGRHAYEVRARRIREDDAQAGLAVLGELGLGADEYRMLIDAERGFLLRSEARRRGDAFLTLEMTMLLIDQQQPAELFVANHSNSAALASSASIRHVPLAWVPRLVDFTVFVPLRVPPCLCRAILRDRGIDPPLVEITYTGLHADGALWLTESTAPISEAFVAADVWWRESDLVIASDDSGDSSRHQIALVRDGTHVALKASGLPKDEVLRLARTLVPLPASPPRLITARTG